MAARSGPSGSSGPAHSPTSPSTSQISDYSAAYQSYSDAAAIAKGGVPQTPTSKKAIRVAAGGAAAEGTAQGGGADTAVGSHYQCWVYDRAAQRASKAPSWQNERPAPGQPDAVSAALVQAPSAFNSPCKMKRALRPPFVVRVMVSFRGRLAYHCKARAYLLTEPQVQNLQVWDPETLGEDEGLDGHEVCHDFSAMGSASPTTVSQDLTFSGLVFTAPTGMRQKFVLFCVSTPAGPALWCLYTLPTVVVSRSVDQYNKAVLILKGIQPMDGRSLRGQQNAAGSAAAAAAAAVKALKRTSPTPDDYEPEGVYTRSYCVSYLLAKYKEAGFSRPLLAADVDFLVELAPFPSGERSSSLAPEAWEEYQGWLDGVALPCLRSIQDLWDQSNPTVICSVATTRDKVEHHLSRSSVGAFTVRPRFKAGAEATWVISTCYLENGRPAIRHILLSADHMRMHNLEFWVRDLEILRFVLDIETGTLRHKDEFFLCGYNRPAREAEEVEAGFVRHAPAPAVAPGPWYGVKPEPHAAAGPEDLGIPQEALDELYRNSQTAALPGIDDLDGVNLDDLVSEFMGDPGGAGVEVSVLPGNLEHSLKNLWS